MTIWYWALGAIAVAVIYVAFVLLVGFENSLALVINFGRIALAVAVLILYVPAIATIFREVPAPGRDYLIAGIILTWASAVCFAVWNEAGRIFGVTTSIFVSPIAGFFSLLLVVGGAFHLSAPAMAGKERKLVAIAIGVAAGAALVFLAPLFR